MPRKATTPIASVSPTSDKATPKKTRTARAPRQRRPGESLTPDEIAVTKSAFLDDYAKHGNIGAACDKACIHRSTIYRWQEQDEVFGLTFQQVKADYCDKLRHEIDRRATQGVLEPVASAGRVVAHVRKFSDTLLIFQAKALMPEYRDKQQVEVTGKDGGPIETKHGQLVSLDLDTLTDEQLIALRAALHDPAKE